MECKLFLPPYRGDNPPELIDTLWNVNLSLIGANRVGTCELIDTLWNVNNSFRDYLQELY